MISPKYFFEKIKDVRLKDICSLVPFGIAYLTSPIFKSKYREAYLICEDPIEARDNGYHFYKYLCEYHPEIDAYYAIDFSSSDYERVANLGGNVIQYGSLQHWIVYLSCKYNISSQKGGKPNSALCAFLELNGLIKIFNVFLQHGVTINNPAWLHADVSKIDLFITSTIPETAFIQENFGYAENTVKCTGMPRFDALQSTTPRNQTILIMPTWRYWFNLRSKKTKGINSVFNESEYFRAWQELLTSDRLSSIAEDNNIEFLFYLHRNLQRFSSRFSTNNRHIKVLKSSDYDIQELLKNCSMLITDYSSVFFDAVYMKKPVLFYQFDEEDYRRFQYQPGYFDYHSNEFGKCFSDLELLIDSIEDSISNGFAVSKDYENKHSQIFPYNDDKNCERIFALLNNI